MQHVPPLVSTIAIALVLAFAFGVVAQRLRLPPLVGYLVAGIAVGPFTPGYVADQNIANQLAEVGVILLMFGVGLHFSLKDLLSVRAIAVPGALAQGLVATPLGMAVGWWLGWPIGAGVIFGIALSVASTVVLLRVLQERRLLETERGRITVGWLIVQDIAMVLVLVLLPGLDALFRGAQTAPEAAEIARLVAVLLGKFAVFVAVMLIVGKKLIPAILHYVAHTGSRELFRLAVLSIALGVAYAAAELFGISLALGAFFAGMMLSESAAEPAGGDASRCRCATPSRCCSSCRSACCSDRPSWSRRRSRCSRPCSSSWSASRRSLMLWCDCSSIRARRR